MFQGRVTARDDEANAPTLLGSDDTARAADPAAPRARLSALPIGARLGGRDVVRELLGSVASASVTVTGADADTTWMTPAATCDRWSRSDARVTRKKIVNFAARPWFNW